MKQKNNNVNPFNYPAKKYSSYVFDAINANQNIKAVYISIFDPLKNETDIIERAYELFYERIHDKSLSVDFYNAQSVALW